MCGGGAYFVAVFDHTTRDLRQRRAAAWRVCVLHRLPSHAYNVASVGGAFIMLCPLHAYNVARWPCAVPPGVV